MRPAPERNLPLVSVLRPSWSREAFASLALALALGCAETRAPTTAASSHWVPGYVFGVWGKAELDVRDDCPTTQARSIRVSATWQTVLVSFISLGLYTPREVRVECQDRP